MKKADTEQKLALDGGSAAVVGKLPGLLRWDDRERQQLAGMISQPSLFYWKGKQTELLVERFRKRYPLDFVMPCSSGTAAIHIALLAAGVGLGDEVITSPITDMGTVTGILYQQGVPVFADLETSRYNLDPADVARKITSRTKVILAVHLAGNPCAMVELKAIADKHNLILIEDCAQAWGSQSHGKPVGTIGHIGCFSLNDFKHIGCGDGGLVATGDPRFGSRLQLCGDKGYDRVKGTRAPDFLAPNYRISEPQSAVAAVQMERLEEITSVRHRFGDLLTAGIRELPGVLPHHVNPEDFCSYWFYMLRLEPAKLSCDRAEFVRALVAEGVPASAGYIPAPLYQYPLFQNENFFGGHWPVKEMGLTSMDYKTVTCPEAEAILATAVKIVINQAMDEDYVRGMAHGIRKVAFHFAKK